MYVFDVRAKKDVNVTKNPFNDAGGIMTPDGRHVVFVSNRTGRGQLHVLDLETGRVRQLATPGSARLPSWSRPIGRGR